MVPKYREKNVPNAEILLSIKKNAPIAFIVIFRVAHNFLATGKKTAEAIQFQPFVYLSQAYLFNRSIFSKHFAGTIELSIGLHYQGRNLDFALNYGCSSESEYFRYLYSAFYLAHNLRINTCYLALYTPLAANYDFTLTNNVSVYVAVYAKVFFSNDASGYLCSRGYSIMYNTIADSLVF